MKYLFLIISLFLTFFLYANEINKEAFPLIKPVSVEEADTSAKSYFADADGDGVSDDKDKCPGTRSGADVNIFGCILLDDSDNDGVSDVDDKCPNSQDGATVNLEGCEPDNDEDGVPDAIDECPDTTKKFTVDKVGCPQTTILQINFKTNSSDITPSSMHKIEEFAEFLEENSGYQAIIYGYTDNKNKTGNNKTLSQNRANTVMDHLIRLGIKLTRLTAIGMGSKNPIADNETPEGRAKNRRIEVELLQ